MVTKKDIFRSTLKHPNTKNTQGDPSRLDHPQGLREQHPDGVQQDSTIS